MARDDVFDILRFLQNFRRKTVRQVEFSDDDLNIDAKVVFVAQNLDYTPPRVLSRRWPVGDLNVYHHIF